MQYLVDRTLLESDVATTQVFFTVGSKIFGQGGTSFTLNEPPPSSKIASFDWNSLFELFPPSVDLSTL